MLPWKALGKGLFRPLSQLLMVPWLAQHEASLHVAFTLCACQTLSTSPLYIRTSVILEQGPILLHCDLISAGDLFNKPVSKSGHILGCWGLGLSTYEFAGDIIQPIRPAINTGFCHIVSWLRRGSCIQRDELKEEIGTVAATIRVHPAYVGRLPRQHPCGFL